MSKTIEIKKVYLRNLLLSFILGFGILYVLEHFGKFSYKADYVSDSMELVEQIPMSTKVLYINYKTYFDSVVNTDGNGWSIYDLSYEDSDFSKYSSKSYYYTQATIKDFKYGVYISLGVFLLTLFFTNFKIKLA